MLADQDPGRTARTILYAEPSTPAQRAHNALEQAKWTTLVRKASGCFPLKAASPLWLHTKDGDWNGQVLHRLHYSNPDTKVNRNGLFVGPGEKLVLLGNDGLAVFAWRRFIDDTGQQGVCCSLFANYSGVQSSDLIREAGQVAWARWPGQRLYTFVDPAKIKSAVPGACFRAAGWRSCGKTGRGLLILEKSA